MRRTLLKMKNPLTMQESKIFLVKQPTVRALINNGWKNFSRGRSAGKISVRHKGGGTKNSIRLVDWKRSLWNIDGVIHSFEYDPRRSALLALVYYPQCKMASYIIAPEGLKLGDRVRAGVDVRLTPGSATVLKNVPLRLKIHNLEPRPLDGGQYCRSAGTWAMIISKSGAKAVVMFSNGNIKEFSLNCMATVGTVGNVLKKSLKRLKAGYSRLKGIRPTVRGVAMNPVDHPHGGGNGKKSPKSVSMSPWKRLGKGIKTSRNN